MTQLSSVVRSETVALRSQITLSYASDDSDMGNGTVFEGTNTIRVILFQKGDPIPF